MSRDNSVFSVYYKRDPLNSIDNDPVTALGLDLAKKWVQVKSIFAEMDRVLIAYSGGIDSSLVAKIAQDICGSQALAVTAVSPSLLPEDLEAALQQAEILGIRHETVETHELEDPNYATNPINRCYFCKSELHDTLKALARIRDYDYIVDGLNADDLQDYRPGVQAAVERGVRSPLAEVGMTKLEVRQLSRYLGLTWWDKPAQPCLSSRFPYGETITPAKLAQVGQAESYLHQLGWRQVRVRLQGDTARIELPLEDIVSFVQNTDLSTLVSTFQQFGFLFVTLDLEGFRSGKLNRVLASQSEQ
jgi:uncharacterized protein